MFNTWMNDPEAFSGDYDEYRQFMQEQAQEKPERDAMDIVREAQEGESQWVEDADCFLSEAQEAEALERYESSLEDDCPLDGDAESALASAGFGTDEDYGYFGGEE